MTEWKEATRNTRHRKTLFHAIRAKPLHSKAGAKQPLPWHHCTRFPIGKLNRQSRYSSGTGHCNQRLRDAHREPCCSPFSCPFRSSPSLVQVRSKVFTINSSSRHFVSRTLNSCIPSCSCVAISLVRNTQLSVDMLMHPQRMAAATKTGAEMRPCSRRRSNHRRWDIFIIHLYIRRFKSSFPSSIPLRPGGIARALQSDFLVLQHNHHLHAL